MYFPEDGAAPAAAEPSALIQGAGGAEAQPDNGSVQQELEPAIDRSKETARASLDRAFAALDQQDEEAAGTANGVKPPAPGALERDDQGRFKAREVAADPGKKPSQSQEQQPGDGKQPVATMEPPPRFSADAKAVWKDVPDPVKGEVGRAFRELETGLKEYREVFEPLRPFYQLAHEKGVEVHEALKNYVAFDQALVSKDPQERLGAIESILGFAGVSPKEYAAFIMGQPADQAQSQNDQTIRELRQEIAGLKNQLGGVTQSMTERRESEVLRQVEAFAEANPRLKEVEFQKTVFRLLETQMAPDLQSAFDMAQRLNPAPVTDAQTTAASTAAATKPGAAQTRNGNLSVTGAPGSGSNPARRKAPATARESVEGAFASLGLG